MPIRVRARGEVPERLKGPVLKTGVAHVVTGGSNPPLSAIFACKTAICAAFSAILWSIQPSRYLPFQFAEVRGCPPWYAAARREIDLDRGLGVRALGPEAALDEGLDLRRRQAGECGPFHW